MTKMNELMTAADLKASRQTMGLSAQGLATLLLMGKDGGRTIRRWESGESAITGPLTVAVRYLLADHIRSQSKKKAA